MAVMVRGKRTLSRRVGVDEGILPIVNDGVCSLSVRLRTFKDGICFLWFENQHALNFYNVHLTVPKTRINMSLGLLQSDF